MYKATIVLIDLDDEIAPPKSALYGSTPQLMKHRTLVERFKSEPDAEQRDDFFYLSGNDRVVYVKSSQVVSIVIEPEADVNADV